MRRYDEMVRGAAVRRSVPALLIALSAVTGSCDGGSDTDAGAAMDGQIPPRDGRVPDGQDGGNPPDLSCLEMIPLRLFTRDPSAVAMLYRIETCAGETVVLDPGPTESVFDYYTLTENGESLSSEAVPDVDRSERQRAYVSLLLDFSSSTRSVEAELLASARAFVEALLAASDRVWIGVEIFDGRAEPVRIQLPTQDLGTLTAAIDGLAGYDDPAADGGSTNLHGAIQSGIGSLASWQELIMSRNGRGVVTTGYVVAFTDGRDTAARVTLEDASAAVASARTADGTEGSANVQTYAVALDGDDFTAEARANLVTALGDDRRPPSHSDAGLRVENRFLYEGSLTQLDARFRELATRIAEQAQATHLLKYCSAARSGEREVELGIQPAIGTAQNSIVFRFSSDGFAPGCAEFIESVCTDRECGGLNCGGCDDSRESCRVDTGQCVNHCVEANECTGATITNPLGYEQTCSPAELGADVMQCGGACVDTSADDGNCGACGNACETLSGDGERCVAGECVCPGGGEVCDGSCQPPSFFEADDANCGACGNACPSGSSCVAGECACPSGQTLCDGACRPPEYFETTLDCGACGNLCPAVGQACVDGACACPSGEVLCDGGCRSSAFFEASASHCGSCGNICSGPCETGTCVDVAELAGGGVHTCARLSDGTARCWGANTRGQLGDGTTTNRDRPAPVIGLSNVAQLSIGRTHGCGRLTDGTVRCWGSNSHGQLGDGTTVDRLVPVSVPGLTGVTATGAGLYHTCAVLTDTTARCWGGNSGGQLGDGTTTQRTSPVAVSELTGVVEVAPGDSHTCARLTDGTGRCWGGNSLGQLGDGSSVSGSSVPVEVSGLTNIVRLASGAFHSCAILSDGSLWCWGANSSGQLGNGTRTDSDVPVSVAGLTNVVEIALGLYHTCARRADNSVWCWGLNNFHQLGTASAASRELSPVALPGLTGVSQLWSGVYHAGVRDAGGSIVAWGGNYFGQLGDRTTIDRSMPVSVLW